MAMILHVTGSFCNNNIVVINNLVIHVMSKDFTFFPLPQFQQWIHPQYVMEKDIKELLGICRAKSASLRFGIIIVMCQCCHLLLTQKMFASRVSNVLNTFIKLDKSQKRSA